MKYAYDHFDEWLGAILLTVMTALAFANVISRYVFNMAIAATDEVTTSLFVLLSLIGAAVAVKRKAHLGLTILVDLLPFWAQKIVSVCASLLGVAFCILLIYYGIISVNHSYTMKQITIGMQWPEWIYVSYIPIGAFILLLRFMDSAVLAARGKGE